MHPTQQGECNDTLRYEVYMMIRPAAAAASNESNESNKANKLKV